MTPDPMNAIGELERLKMVALAATPYRYRYDGHGDNYLEAADGAVVGLLEGFREPDDLTFIATFDPPTVLKLIALARLAALSKAEAHVEGEPDATDLFEAMEAALVEGTPTLSLQDGKVWIDGETAFDARKIILSLFSGGKGDLGSSRDLSPSASGPLPAANPQAAVPSDGAVSLEEGR